MDVNKIICVTTFRQGNPENRIEELRTKVFLDTAVKFADAGLPFVIVYIETQKDILEKLEELGLILCLQQSTGMGNIRREAMFEALKAFPEAKYLCWLEPEKPDMVRFVKPMCSKMEQEQSVLGMFNRITMSSYPAEQAHYYLFCRAVATQLIGFDLDYAFGPMMVVNSAVSYFLEYRGEYGDKWDSILIPRLRIINGNTGMSVLPVDFQNDPRMTLAESGNPAIILKRLEQFNNVIPSLISEWERLVENSENR
jgi:hypothetical protein